MSFLEYYISFMRCIFIRHEEDIIYRKEVSNSEHFINYVAKDKDYFKNNSILFRFLHPYSY